MKLMLQLFEWDRKGVLQPNMYFTILYPSLDFCSFTVYTKLQLRKLINITDNALQWNLFTLCIILKKKPNKVQFMQFTYQLVV
jgi:hypothetical protein